MYWYGIGKKFEFRFQFSFPVFWCTKHVKFHFGGYKNRRLETNVISFQDFKLREKQISPTFSYFLINNALLYHFLADWLAHNKKMPCFWCCGFVPHRKWNLTLLVHQNMGQGNHYQKKFCYTLGRFNRANKKNLSYTLPRVVNGSNWHNLEISHHDV